MENSRQDTVLSVAVAAVYYAILLPYQQCRMCNVVSNHPCYCASKIKNH